jgi:cation transport ATPase
VIGLSDSMRSGGRDAVADLRGTGVERVVLLTGDIRASAERPWLAPDWMKCTPN